MTLPAVLLLLSDLPSHSESASSQPSSPTTLRSALHQPQPRQKEDCRFIKTFLMMKYGPVSCDSSLLIYFNVEVSGKFPRRWQREVKSSSGSSLPASQASSHCLYWEATGRLCRRKWNIWMEVDIDLKVKCRDWHQCQVRAVTTHFYPISDLWRFVGKLFSLWQD